MPINTDRVFTNWDSAVAVALLLGRRGSRKHRISGVRLTRGWAWRVEPVRRWV